MNDLVLPRITSTLWVFGTFTVAVVVLHLVFVVWLPLSKVTWKKVDYIWLPLTLVGIVGSLGSVRREIASNMLNTAQARVTFAAEEIEASIAFGHGPAICRTFVRNEFSPPPEEFERTQREFDELCAWFRSASERLPQTPFGKRDFLRLEDFGAAPPTGADQWAVARLRDSINTYNEAVAKAKELSHEMKRPEFEFTLAILGPPFIAVALALRITKVTGEIKLEGQRSPT